MATRRGDRKARRDDILEAGRAALREKGLAGLQMREVAKLAGVGLGTVYTYFATKETLHAALYAEALASMIADLEPATAGGMNAEQLFVRFATGYRNMYADFGRDFDYLAVLSGDGALEPTVLEQLAKSTTRLMKLMRGVIAQYGAEDPDQTLVVLWSTATGLAEHFTGPRHAFHGLSWEDTVEFTARTFVRSLLPERQTS